MRLRWLESHDVMPFKTRTVKCPGGRRVRVYRRADDAFPVVATSVNASLRSTLATAEQLSGSLEGAAAREVKEVATRLDHVNQSLRERLRAVYVVYQADPCGNGHYLAEEVRRINQQEERLRETAISLENLLRLHASGTPDSELLALVRHVADKLNPIPPSHGDQQRAIEDNAQRWQRELSE